MASATFLAGENLSIDARELLVSNLALIDRAVDFACRRNRMTPDDTEEFRAVVRLKLVENDYGILRKYEGRSSLASYLGVVVQRMLLDYRIHAWGKWHASAEAKRMGDLAVEVEKLLHRDGRAMEEIAEILGGRADRAAIERIASQLPARPPKRRAVDLDEAADVATPPPEIAPGRHRLSATISSIVRAVIDGLPVDDRLILQLRFDSEMSVAEIARSLGLDQKQLYRRIERHLREIRQRLEDAGIAADEAREILGDRGTVLDFQLARSPSRSGGGEIVQ